MMDLSDWHVAFEYARGCKGVREWNYRLRTIHGSTPMMECNMQVHRSPRCAVHSTVRSHLSRSFHTRIHPFVCAMSDPYRRELSLIARNHMNSKCADCRAKAPTHACSALGVFLCHHCAECHRQLPANMQSIRSLMYDTWDAESVGVVATIGNLKSNARYEATLNIRVRDGTCEFGFAATE